MGAVRERLRSRRPTMRRWFRSEVVVALGHSVATPHVSTEGVSTRTHDVPVGVDRDIVMRPAAEHL